jgi:2-polyprenyl-3-methyl-5-hydroxy-6-metoxy-1,4-benzoquinol methylase
VKVAGNFDGGGNYYNKYESRNPVVRALMKKYFTDLDSLILPIKNEVSTALEIGCGEGYISKHIQDLGINIEGTDISDRIIQVARKLHPSVEFRTQSIYDLDGSKKKYDIIFVNQVLEHLEATDAALLQIQKSTSNYLFFSVPNEPFFRVANLMRLNYLSDLGNPPGHINHWSKKRFQHFLESNNLDIITISTSTLWILALCKIRL